MWWGDWRIEAATLLVAIVVDLATREAPAAIHPVVWMGKLITGLERLAPGPVRRVVSLAAGVGMATLVPVAAGGLAWLAAVGLREVGSIAYVAAESVLLSTTFAVRELGRAANRTRSAIESVAENTTDSFVDGTDSPRRERQAQPG